MDDVELPDNISVQLYIVCNIWSEHGLFIVLYELINLTQLSESFRFAILVQKKKKEEFFRSLNTSED